VCRKAEGEAWEERKRGKKREAKRERGLGSSMRHLGLLIAMGSLSQVCIREQNDHSFIGEESYKLQGTKWAGGQL
jgi:hypothetical protein